MANTKVMHIRLPDDIATRLDAFLQSRDISRSGFITEAVAEKLCREIQVQKLKETRGILEPEDAPEWFNSPSAKWVREIREQERDITWRPF
ncbi:CopG family transcriptional regulator [Moorella naiadis]|uniref:ribbon-helix-helix domain-containing protein n=1 Tax=Moorella naiadis (nom. illeg.) TaxID=3093670 RepID=UPI003D9C846D